MTQLVLLLMMFVLQISIEDKVRLEIFTEGQKTQALCVPNFLNFRYNYSNVP